MRFAVATSLLLFAGAVGCMASCSSPPPSDDDDEGLTDDEINGQDNRMGLRLIYDDASHSLRATVKQKLRAGEVLKLNVRRGRLSAESERLLDCGALPDAPALPPVEDNTGAVASPSSSASGVAPARVVYQGPTVDSSLLVSVYDDAWIQGNITPVMLDRLARDGADSIVEACIVKGDRVRARVQTTVAYAWDEADPNLREMDIDRASFEGIHLTTGDGRTSPKTKLGVPIRSMEKYAEVCVSELGEIPFFKKIAKGKYDTFDCRDFVDAGGKPIAGIEGALIPQAVHDADGKDVTPRACDAKNASRYDCFRTCDKPEWMSQSCEPGPTVATAKNEQGTHWTLLCRGAGPRDGASSVDELTHTKTFNDISMIGHNPKTGKTCFFQNKVFDGTNGAKIPHPADVQKSRDLWDAPKGHCMRCHSADAFVHSPWIDGAKRKDGTTIVPRMGEHPDFLANAETPYSIVNRAAQAKATVGGSAWEVPKQLVSPEASACTACHRIGGGDGMRRFPMWATGEEGLDRTARGTAGPILDRYSPQAKTFESMHWMPLGQGQSAESWASSPFAKATHHIRSCAENDAAPGCTWADVPEK